MSAAQGQITMSLAPGTHAKLSALREQLRTDHARKITYSETIEMLIANSTLPQLAPAQAAK